MCERALIGRHDAATPAKRNRTVPNQGVNGTKSTEKKGNRLEVFTGQNPPGKQGTVPKKLFTGQTVSKTSANGH
jgi:hypothetical protein